MSWTPDLIIGELRPWPDAVCVRRGDTDEARRYVPEKACQYEEKDGWFVCSNCGRRTQAYEGKGDPLSLPRFCQDCGAKVVDA